MAAWAEPLLSSRPLAHGKLAVTPAGPDGGDERAAPPNLPPSLVRSVGRLTPHDLQQVRDELTELEQVLRNQLQVEPVSPEAARRGAERAVRLALLIQMTERRLEHLKERLDVG